MHSNPRGDAVPVLVMKALKSHRSYSGYKETGILPGEKHVQHALIEHNNIPHGPDHKTVLHGASLWTKVFARLDCDEVLGTVRAQLEQLDADLRRYRLAPDPIPVKKPLARRPSVAHPFSSERAPALWISLRLVL